MKTQMTLHCYVPLDVMNNWVALDKSPYWENVHIFKNQLQQKTVNHLFNTFWGLVKCVSENFKITLEFIFI